MISRPGALDRAISVVLWAVFVIALTEMAFRLVVFPDYRALQQDVYVRHPVFGHYNKPNAEIRRYNPMNYDVVNHTNSLGFRGRNEDRERELEGVWVAGFSNTFGGYLQDDDVYAAQLKKYGYWAANLSSEGHSLPQQVMVIRQMAASGYKPKAVILEILSPFLIQDYGNIDEFITGPIAPSSRSSGAVLVQLRATESLRSGIVSLSRAVPLSLIDIRARLIKNSAVYGWLKVGIMGVRFLRDVTLQLGLRTDVDLVYNYSLDLLKPIRPEGESAQMLDSTADFTAAIARLVREQLGVPFAVVLLPNHHQIYPQRFARYLHAHGLTGQDLQADRPLTALATRLRARGIPILDTTAQLRVNNNEMLIFPDDAHLNAAGHAIVAKAIAEWLKRDLDVAATR